jgi:hypothetical protein
MYAAPRCDDAAGAPTISVFPLSDADQLKSSFCVPFDSRIFALKCDVDFRPVAGFMKMYAAPCVAGNNG